MCPLLRKTLSSFLHYYKNSTTTRFCTYIYIKITNAICAFTAGGFVHSSSLELNVEGEMRMGSVPRLAVHQGHDHPTIRTIEPADLLHLLLAKGEVGHVAVLFDPGGRDRLGDDNDAPLDLPADEDLCGGLLVLGCDVLDLVVVHELWVSGLGPGAVRRPEGGVGGQADAALLAELEQLGLAQVGVALHLVGHRGDAALAQHVADLLRVEVGESDGLGEAQANQLLHGEPGGRWVNFIIILQAPVLILREAIVAPLEGSWPVDEVEVQVVHPKVGQGLPAGSLHVLRVVLVVPQLGGDEDLLPGNPGGSDTRSDLNRKFRI